MQASSVTRSKCRDDCHQVSTMATQRPIVDRGVTMYLLAAWEASVRQIR